MVCTGGNGDSEGFSVWINKTSERNNRLLPLYMKAIQDENLQDLILLRQQMASIVMEADKIIVDFLVNRIERRIHDDG